MEQFALKVFYAPVAPFHTHPERAFFVAVLFAILFVASRARSRAFKPRHLALILAVLGWILFGLVEARAVERL